MTIATPIDPDHLTSDQVEQLEYILRMYTLHQLLQIAAITRRIEKQIGFGHILIRIEKGHPDLIEEAQKTKLLPNLEDEMVRELMKHTAPLNPNRLPRT